MGFSVFPDSCMMPPVLKEWGSQPCPKNSCICRPWGDGKAPKQPAMEVLVTPRTEKSLWLGKAKDMATCDKVILFPELLLAWNTICHREGRKSWCLGWHVHSVQEPKQNNNYHGQNQLCTEGSLTGNFRKPPAKWNSKLVPVGGGQREAEKTGKTLQTAKCKLNKQGNSPISLITSGPKMSTDLHTCPQEP